MPWWQPGQPIYPADSPYWAPIPTPYNLDYQVTLYGRFWAAHIAPVVAQLATLPRLPAKIGRLWVPQDNTMRTMRLLGVAGEQPIPHDQDAGVVLVQVVTVAGVVHAVV